MAIEHRDARGFGVVAVPDGDVLQANGGVKLRQRLVQTCFADDVIAGDVGMAGINPSTHREKSHQLSQNFPKLLEPAPPRIFRSCGAFDPDAQAPSPPAYPPS